MKRFLFLLMAAAALAAPPSLSQDLVDVIHLKNGDILKGTIVENIINQYVRIELQGGSVLTVKYSEILKITKESSAAAEPQVQPRSFPPGATQDMDKNMRYEDGKKSSGTAVVLSIVVTSAGHAYAGNWGRGLLFAAGRVAGVALALTAGFHSSTYSTANPYGYSWNYYYASPTEITPWFYVGVGTALVFAVWEAFDASAEVDRYNARLYKRIMGVKRYSFEIVPGRNGAQLQFSCFF